MAERITPPQATPEQQLAFGQKALEAINQDAAKGIITEQDAAAEQKSVVEQMKAIIEQPQITPTS